VTKEYLDARLSQLEARLEAKFETKLAQVQNRLLASQVACSSCSASQSC
jgi:hypothetical protein